MYETNNDLSETTRRSVIEILNEHLADAIDLQLQAKQAHWNIKGPNFVGLHELFDQVAAQARRVRRPDRRESRRARWSRTRNTPGGVSGSHSSASIRSKPVTGGLTFRRCRMRSRRSAGAYAKPSTMRQH